MNIALDPVSVRTLGMNRIMPPPHHIMQLIQQLRLIGVYTELII